MPDVGCNMSGGKSQCWLETPPLSPRLQLNQSLRNRVFHLQSIWNWGNQPDVQSCLLKQSPCLGFGSWTDSQPCGMAAVEGLFKLHPGWWVAVRRAMDREFRKGGEKKDRSRRERRGRECGAPDTEVYRKNKYLKSWKKNVQEYKLKEAEKAMIGECYWGRGIGKVRGVGGLLTLVVE